MLTAKEVRRVLDAGQADSIGTCKEGVILRLGFYYTNGRTAAQFEAMVMSGLKRAGLQPELVRSGEVWAPFRGGASVARNSHWYAIVK